MSRLPRIEDPGASYHAMNRGLAYQDAFTNQADRQRFLNIVTQCCLDNTLSLIHTLVHPGYDDDSLMGKVVKIAISLPADLLEALEKERQAETRVGVRSSV